MRIIWWIIDRPVWLDEAMLALGIVHRPLGAVLLAPLPYGQITPPGFLVVQWVMASMFGTSGRVLRLAPLVASLIALPLFARLARRVLVDDRLVTAAVWLFALNRAFVMYAVEAKPYAWDVTATLALLLVVMEQRAIMASVLGAILVWCSYPVTIVLAALAIIVRRPSVISVWVLSAAPAIWVAEHRLSARDRGYLHRFWSDGFWRTWSWPITQPSRVLDALLRVPPGIVWLALVVVGLWFMSRREKALPVMMPALVAIAAAAFGFYPLASRLALYLLPGALLAIAAIDRWWIIVPLVIAQGVESLLPERHEDVRTVATAMARLRQPGDAVYVYYGAVPTFEYYADTTGITRGGCHRTDWPAYVRELEPMRGRKRVWLVVAHEFEGNGVREDSLLVRYLNATGHAYLTIPARSAFAMLYDLSGPANAVDITAPRSTHVRQPNLGCRTGSP
ncbi:MAG TPA: hypothetical protein VFA43_26070 [Gemmatimonadaceae bacterium]|nr:hypothetical protein [Gemmatimonadaceae bacterium]